MLVDGAQSVGAIPVAAAGFDYLTVSGQKWLCGPDSTGALVVADPERLRVSAPSYFSQAEYEPDGQFRPKPGAARFDTGWWPAVVARGPAGGARRPPVLGLRPCRRRRRALPGAPRRAGRAWSSPADGERSTLVAFRARRRAGRARRGALRRRRARPRDPERGPDPRLLRLVDLGRRPRPAARRAARVTSQGACPCGAVRFAIYGPVRDVIVCHCDAVPAAPPAGRGRRRPPTGATSPSGTMRR